MKSKMIALRTRRPSLPPYPTASSALCSPIVAETWSGPLVSSSRSPSSVPSAAGMQHELLLEDMTDYQLEAEELGNALLKFPITGFPIVFCSVIDAVDRAAFLCRDCVACAENW